MDAAPAGLCGVCGSSVVKIGSGLPFAAGAVSRNIIMKTRLGVGQHAALLTCDDWLSLNPDMSNLSCMEQSTGRA